MDSVVPASALTVLADPTRARILRLIHDAEGGRALVGRLAKELGLRQPTVSHHMAALYAEGIVSREPEGRRVWYSIDPDQEQRVMALLGDAPASAEEPDWDRVVDDLAIRYQGTFNRETVARHLADSRELLAAHGDSTPSASRAAAFTTARLDDVHHAAHPTGAPRVLFVCVQNAGRSQLAAGILRQLAGERVVVRTAGSAPARDVRAAIVAVLDEIGIALGGEFPKPLTDEAVQAADVVVTMGCGDACPVFPGRRYLDWDLEDPVGKPLAAVRAIRDDIDGRVRALLPELKRGPTMSEKPTVLFVCVHNAGRSQMAAGYLQSLAGERIEVLSAGSEPKDRLNPVAVTVMAEEGIDIATNTPRLLTVDAVREADVVITMGCGDACPVFPGKRYEDWRLDDPAGQDADTVRRIRDEIRSRVEALVAELLPTGRVA